MNNLFQSFWNALEKTKKVLFSNKTIKTTSQISTLIAWILFSQNAFATDNAENTQADIETVKAEQSMWSVNINLGLSDLTWNVKGSSNGKFTKNISVGNNWMVQINTSNMNITSDFIFVLEQSNKLRTVVKLDKNGEAQILSNVTRSDALLLIQRKATLQQGAEIQNNAVDTKKIETLQKEIQENIEPEIKTTKKQELKKSNIAPSGDDEEFIEIYSSEVNKIQASSNRAHELIQKHNSLVKKLSGNVLLGMDLSDREKNQLRSSYKQIKKQTQEDKLAKNAQGGWNIEFHISDENKAFMNETGLNFDSNGQYGSFTTGITVEKDINFGYKKDFSGENYKADVSASFGINSDREKIYDLNGKIITGSKEKKNRFGVIAEYSKSESQQDELKYAKVAKEFSISDDENAGSHIISAAAANYKKGGNTFMIPETEVEYDYELNQKSFGAGYDYLFNKMGTSYLESAGIFYSQHVVEDVDFPSFILLKDGEGEIIN